jgi:hypothetical protein
MAEPYFSQLKQILEALNIPEATLECKHFFSGAAMYANGKICASLGPAGFAVKLPEDQREALIDEEKGEKFRFFPNGPVKREYVLLNETVVQDEKVLFEIIDLSVSYVQGELD